jgi:hypothetical protein
MKNFSSNSFHRPAFQRLCAASVGSGARLDAGSRSQGRPRDPAFLAQLQSAVDATSESARVLDAARSTAEDVQNANQSSAQARVVDVDGAVQLAVQLAERLSAARRRGEEALEGGLSVAAVHRLLG